MESSENKNNHQEPSLSVQGLCACAHAGYRCRGRVGRGGESASAPVGATSTLRRMCSHSHQPTADAVNGLGFSPIFLRSRNCTRGRTTVLSSQQNICERTSQTLWDLGITNCIQRFPDLHAWYTPHSLHSIRPGTRVAAYLFPPSTSPKG